MFEMTVAADIGSAFTRIAVGERTVADESRAALDPSDPRRVLAFGSAAGRLLNASEAYPVRDGISDIDLTALMLKRLALDAAKRHTLFGMSLAVALPACVRGTERDAAFAVGRAAGFRRIAAVEGLLAGAVGAGLDIGGETASMIVDIGRSSVGIMTIANGGAVASSRAGFGSAAFDRSIIAWLAENKGVLIGARTAERLKKHSGEACVRVGGNDLSSGRSQRTEITGEELSLAMLPAMQRLITAIASAMNELPPEAAADLLDNGITLIGGGAKLHGLNSALSDALGVPVRTAEDPANAIINGMRLVMRGETELQAVGIK